MVELQLTRTLKANIAQDRIAFPMKASTMKLNVWDLVFGIALLGTPP